VSTQKTAHPFIYGRPVRPNEFLSRELELRTIFNRIRNGESTAVVGDPHIGKSSLLLKLADEATQRQYLGNDAEALITVSIDLQPISSDYCLEMFWEEVLEPLYDSNDDHTLTQLLERVVNGRYQRRPLEQLFNHLGRQGKKLVLLLDEFERLLAHPRFKDPAFFALLRSLATRTGGLAIVIASRLPVSDVVMAS
jgi:Cdc6-like AAA superfamily ATPase